MAHLLLILLQSSAFCAHGLFLVSLACRHLLGAPLSLWSDSSHSACVEPHKGWRPLLRLGGSWLVGHRLGCGGGCVKMAPPTPNLHPLHRFFRVMSSLKTATATAQVSVCGVVMLQSCARIGQRSRMTSQPTMGEVCEKVLYLETSYALPTHWAQPGLELSPLLCLLCIPACTALSSQLGNFQSVSTICSPNPPLPNYNTRRSRTIQRTPRCSAASD